MSMSLRRSGILRTDAPFYNPWGRTQASWAEASSVAPKAGQEARVTARTQSKTCLPVVLPSEPYTRGSATNLELVLRRVDLPIIFVLLIAAASGLAESVVAGRIVD